MNKYWFFVLGLCAVAPFGLIRPAVIAQAQTPEVAPPTVALPATTEADGAGFVPDFLAVDDQPFSDDVRAIIGEDDRAPVLNLVYPYSTIGRLDWVNADGFSLGHCTATLIGPDIILTNSHCLVNPYTESIAAEPNTQPERLVFRPALIDGDTLDWAVVIDYEYGWEQAPEDPSQDWAVLRLNRPLGEDYGYLGWRNLDFTDPQVLSATDRNLTTVGYSGDFPTPQYQQWGAPGETAGRHVGCSIVDAGTGELSGWLFHACDTNPGASGGPIFARFEDGQYYIVGLHAGANEFTEPISFRSGFSSALINRGVQVSQWAPTAREMQ
jgi:protease YdgD